MSTALSLYVATATRENCSHLARLRRPLIRSCVAGSRNFDTTYPICPFTCTTPRRRSQPNRAPVLRSAAVSHLLV